MRPHFAHPVMRSQAINAAADLAAHIKKAHYHDEDVQLVHVPIGPGGFGHEDLLDNQRAKAGFADRTTLE